MTKDRNNMNIRPVWSITGWRGDVLNPKFLLVTGAEIPNLGKG